MTDMSITVLIPTYNHAAYITEAIESVRDQSIFNSCRVIVSDDCSSDETVEIARAAASNFPNITVRQNPSNIGIMAHYRLLASFVETPYTAILEGDDYWHAPEKMELQKSLMDAHPGVGICFTACLVKEEATGVSWHHPGWPINRHRIISLLDMLTDNPIATFSNCFYRANRFSEILAKSDVKRGYDWLLNMTLASNGGTLFAARTCTSYRLHEKGTWTRMSPEEKRSGIVDSLLALRGNVDRSFAAYIDAAITRAKNER